MCPLPGVWLSHNSRTAPEGIPSVPSPSRTWSLYLNETVWPGHLEPSLNRSSWTKSFLQLRGLGAGELEEGRLGKGSRMPRRVWDVLRRRGTGS